MVQPGGGWSSSSRRTGYERNRRRIRISARLAALPERFLAAVLTMVALGQVAVESGLGERLAAAFVFGLSGVVLAARLTAPGAKQPVGELFAVVGQQPGDPDLAGFVQVT